MASTPFVFFSGLLFLAWFTADVHSVKVIDVLKGSPVVLSPVESVTSITSITWKHNDDLAAEWLGGHKAFYRIFNNGCSLNTETGQLTINNVRPEHSGVYTPDINGKTRSAMKLRVLSPVPKPSIDMNCNPEKTKCTLTCTLSLTLTCSDTCKIDTAGDLGDVEVFWILDDRRVNVTELQITKDTKEETFVCSLKNSVSSENSFKLQNPLIPRVPVWKPVVITLAAVAVALLVFVCWKWIYPKCRLWRIIREIQETMPLTEHDRNSAETPAAGSVTEHDRILEEIKDAGLVPDVEIKLLDADKEILRILRKGNETNLSEDSILKLLTARYLILRTLQQGSAVQESLEKVKKIIKKFFRGRNDLWLYKYEKQTFQDVQRILRILNKRNELKLPRVFTDEEMTLLKFRKILNKRNYLQLSEDEKKTLQDVCEKILTLIKREEETVVRDEQSPPNEKEQGSLNGRPEAADPLISSSRPEVPV